MAAMSDIFISYASKDRDRVLPLVRALAKTGWTIFWDRTIPAGKTWRQVMGTEIQACRSVIVVWTRNSVNSEWVLEEAEIGKRKQILVPVLFDEVEPPFGFAFIQAANLVAWNGSNSDASCGRLISDIETILGPAPAKGLEAESRRGLKEEPERKTEQERFHEQEARRSDEKGVRQAESKLANVSEDLKYERVKAPAPSTWAGQRGSLFLRTLISGATKSSAWFIRIAGTFSVTLIVSVILLVVFEISLGWFFTAAEVSVIVLFVWVIVVAITTLRNRSKRKRAHATN
jgi:hypothetical protein